MKSLRAQWRACLGCVLCKSLDLLPCFPFTLGPPVVGSQRMYPLLVCWEGTGWSCHSDLVSLTQGALKAGFASGQLERWPGIVLSWV